MGDQDRSSARPASARRGWLSRILRRRAEDPAMQAFRQLATRLRFDLGAGPGGRALMITSPAGPSVAVRAAVLLARFLARDRSCAVLLVDGSFGERELSRELGVPEDGGFLDVLEGIAGGRPAADLLREFSVPTEEDGVSCLPAGSSTLGLADLLQEVHIASFLAQAVREHGFVLIQTGSVLDDADSLAFPSLVDCVLLMTAEGRTRLRDLDASRKALEMVGARRVGLVLTSSDGRSAG